MKTLFEGGNIFKNAEGPLTDRIATKDVESTVSFIEKITGLDFTAEKGEDNKPVKWLGTTGRKENPDGTFELNSSGDLDLSVDANEASKEQVIEKLAAWCIDNGVDPEALYNKGRKITDRWIKDAGDQVHFKTPINGDPTNGFVQTDFMFSDNPEFQRGSMIGGSEKYRGEHRHILLSSIARARGMKYSPKFGLVDPDTNEVVSSDWNTIAKHLLGQTATVADIRSVEKITDYIKKLPNYEELVAAARETLGKYGVELPAKESLENYTEGSRDWFRAMMDKVGGNKQELQKEKKNFIFYLDPNIADRVVTFLRDNNFAHMVSNSRTTITNQYRVVVNTPAARDALINKFGLEEYRSKR